MSRLVRLIFVAVNNVKNPNFCVRLNFLTRKCPNCKKRLGHIGGEHGIICLHMNHNGVSKLEMSTIRVNGMIYVAAKCRSLHFRTCTSCHCGCKVLSESQVFRPTYFFERKTS